MYSIILRSNLCKSLKLNKIIPIYYLYFTLFLLKNTARPEHQKIEYLNGILHKTLVIPMDAALRCNGVLRVLSGRGSSRLLTVGKYQKRRGKKGILLIHLSWKKSCPNSSYGVFPLDTPLILPTRLVLI